MFISNPPRTTALLAPTLVKTVKALVLLCCLTISLPLAAAAIVDVNRADAATMIENWKGIGEVKAKAIVAYRKKNGPFKSIDDLANVKGIGAGLLKNNRKLMSTSRGAVKPTGKARASTGSTAAKKSDSTKKSKTKKSSSQTKSDSGTSKKQKSSTSSKKSTDRKKDSKSKSRSTTKKSGSSKKSTSKKKSSKKPAS